MKLEKSLIYNFFVWGFFAGMAIAIAFKLNH